MDPLELGVRRLAWLDHRDAAAPRALGDAIENGRPVWRLGMSRRRQVIAEAG
jgi:hypothetical protein